MKTLFLLLFVVSFTFVHSQTTLEEYNYVTKGIIDHFNRGLDIKSGYVVSQPILKNQYEQWGNKRECVLYSFKKDDGKKLACHIVRLTASNGFIKFLCIPSKTSPTDIYVLYANDVKGLDSTWHYLLMDLFIKSFILSE